MSQNVLNATLIQHKALYSLPCSLHLLHLPLYLSTHSVSSLSLCDRGGGQAAEAPSLAEAGVCEDAAEAGWHREAMCRAGCSNLRPGLHQHLRNRGRRHLHQPSAWHRGPALPAGPVQVRGTGGEEVWYNVCSNVCCCHGYSQKEDQLGFFFLS